MRSKSILVINGPNLNLLGSRESEQYGDTTLAKINEGLQRKAENYQINLLTQQSNSEQTITELIQGCTSQNIDLIIINPAALTHTSIAIRDALLAVAVPFIEVHISNVYSREDFRHTSYLSDIANGVIIGFGPYGYSLALEAGNNILNNKC